MALKSDRHELMTDISFFMNEVKERGFVAVLSTGGSGSAMVKRPWVFCLTIWSILTRLVSILTGTRTKFRRVAKLPFYNTDGLLQTPSTPPTRLSRDRQLLLAIVATLVMATRSMAPVAEARQLPALLVVSSPAWTRMGTPRHLLACPTATIQTFNLR